MDSAYPGSNILVVTLTNGESKRVEAQLDEETLKEAMEVLRDMFGSDIPDATDILVPRWWNNRFQRGSYSNYPIISNNQLVQEIKVQMSVDRWDCISCFNLHSTFMLMRCHIMFRGHAKMKSWLSQRLW